MEPIWIDWAKRLQAIAQTGLTYAESPYDVERYEAVRHIAAEMAANRSDTELPARARSVFERHRLCHAQGRCARGDLSQ